MRTRNRLLVAFGATVLAAGAALAVMSPASAANLLVNPGFETGTMSGWSCSNGSIVSSPVHTGNRALKGAATSSDHAKCTQTVTVQPNTAYVLSAWVRGNYVYLGITGGPSTWTPSAASYTQLKTTFTTGANQTSAQVYLHGWYAQGDYHADDVSLDGPGGNDPSPTPTPTTSPTSSPPPPPPPSGGAMAAPYLYMGWGNPPSPGTVMSATGIKQFTMAFMLSGGGCTPAWDSQRPLRGGADEQAINAIRANGGDVEISFGGWSGNKLGPNCSSASALAGAYQQVINAYNLKYIDIDIENTDEFENATVQDRILSALKIVKQNNPGIKTIITFGTSQSGPNWWGTRLIDRSAELQANIDNFTIMPFDFGCHSNIYTCTVNASEGLKNALKSAYGWSDATAYAHMGISGMNGLSDQQEMTSLDHWRQIRDWANSKGLKRLSFWSVNRDRGCPGGGVRSDCSGISQNNWDFTRITAGFTG